MLPHLDEFEEMPLLSNPTLSSDGSGCGFEEPSCGPQLFNRDKLNDLVRYLNLSKEQS